MLLNIHYIEQEILGRNNRLLSFYMILAALKTTPPTVLLLRVFAATETCLRSRYLATTGEIHIHTNTLMERIYVVQR
jgi:hypothetical protein